MPSDIEIVVGDVTDVEAHVIARYHGPMTDVDLSGTLRGPFCDKGRTLPAEFVFRDFGDANGVKVETIVPDPCMWTPEMPHLYQADVEARQGEQLIAEYHGTIGLRRLAPGGPSISPQAPVEKGLAPKLPLAPKLGGLHLIS